VSDAGLTELEARKALVAAGQRLMDEGLVARSWGNLSLRLDAKSMAITPSGIPYADLRERMIVIVDLESGEWKGEWKPSGERALHRAIYRTRPEVGAIVHSHQNAASACAAARVPVRAPWGEVPCAPYALPSTPALAKATVATLGDRPAVLLANHGVFTVGANLDEAFGRAAALETACASFLESEATTKLPARADAAWNQGDLSATVLADGFPALMSRAPYTLAWAERGISLPAVLDDLAQLVGTKVPAVAALPQSAPKEKALLVKGRGLLVSGPDAEALAMVVEKAARAAICGEAFGGAVTLPPLEARLMHFVYRQSYAKRAKKAVAAE
jgi:L-ribulose-5-phosphate 4-epimerase